MSSPGSPPMIQSVDSMLSQSSVNDYGGGGNKSMSGNQPSTILICGKCDAFTCGQLIALAEHRALVKAWLWDADPFATMRSSIREERHEYLLEKLHKMNHHSDKSTSPDLNDGENQADHKDIMHAATRVVLQDYSARMMKHRN